MQYVTSPGIHMYVVPTRDHRAVFITLPIAGILSGLDASRVVVL